MGDESIIFGFMLCKRLLKQPTYHSVAFTGAYFTIEVEQMGPVFRSGVFEHGAEKIWHIAAASFHSGVLS